MTEASPPYVPDRGDLMWLDFSPQAGHEQAGRRPAFVVSPASYNGRAGLALVCSITSQVKRYPFEVPLPAGLAVLALFLLTGCGAWTGARGRPTSRIGRLRRWSARLYRDSGDCSRRQGVR